METVKTTSRSPVATSSGAGIGLVFVWIWQSYFVTRWGQPEMPAEVAGVVVLVLTDVFRWLGTRVQDKSVEQVQAEQEGQSP